MEYKIEEKNRLDAGFPVCDMRITGAKLLQAQP